MPQVNQENRDRIKSALVVGVVHAVLGYALITGLGVSFVQEVGRELKTFNVAEPPPPPPTAQPAAPEEVKVSKHAKPKDPEGAASPANLRDTPIQIVAPPPEVRLEVPPPITAAPVAGQGNAEAAGAADVPGPGTGSGGIGNGLGSGSFGNGTGGGGGGLGRATPARFIRGAIYDSDYPRRAMEARQQGTVHLRFVVLPDGRVGNCTVTRSSGSRDLDTTTCRLIERRFRYEPARNAEGRRISQVIPGTHDWELAPEPPPIDVEPDIPDW